jgi:hypothetical protein
MWDCHSRRRSERQVFRSKKHPLLLQVRECWLAVPHAHPGLGASDRDERPAVGRSAMRRHANDGAGGSRSDASRHRPVGAGESSSPSRRAPTFVSMLKVVRRGGIRMGELTTRIVIRQQLNADRRILRHGLNSNEISGEPPSSGGDALREREGVT